ncbi:MAG: DUF4168 domain-containing protein [Candidatus Manganitrophaceae bacterium]|nr:MAG: DUF4168 domain-containing protein [Candidatus Manganitrophaceae bacterium]
MKNIQRDLRRLILLLFIAVGLFGGATESAADNPAAAPNPAEIEKYVKARIELGESMRDYFKQLAAKPRSGNPDGEAPSREEMKKMEEEINAHVAKILAKHNLTIEEYQKRSPEVLADTEGVNRFLADHPDLKKRYEALPPSPMRRKR